jgi:hypothetical protein
MTLSFISRGRNSEQADEVTSGPISFRKVDGKLELHALDQTGPQLIGRFNSAAAAWAALDELDLADDVRLAA